MSSSWLQCTFQAIFNKIWNLCRWGPFQNNLQLKNDQEYFPVCRLTGWLCCLAFPLIPHPCNFLSNYSQFSMKKIQFKVFCKYFTFLFLLTSPQVSKCICIWFTNWKYHKVLFSFANTQSKFLRKQCPFPFYKQLFSIPFYDSSFSDKI